MEEGIPGNILLTNQNSSISAIADISISLEDGGQNFNSKKVQDNSSEINDQTEISSDVATDFILENDATRKIIEELTEWKEKEQKKFSKYLKSDYQTKKLLCEEKLARKSKKLNELSQSLKTIHDALDQQNLEEVQKEESNIRKQQELQRSYIDELTALRERMKQTEENSLKEINDKDARIQELESIKNELYDKLETSVRENGRLMKNLEDLNHKYENLKYKNVASRRVVSSSTCRMVSSLTIH